MLYSKEQIERANSRSIAEYFERAGYSCKHANGETHIRGFGGFYVKDNTQQFYIHSQHKGGVGLVNCLMKVFDMPFKEAVKEALDGEDGNERSQPRSTSYTRNYGAGARPSETVRPPEAANPAVVCKAQPIEENIPPAYEPKREFVMPERNADNKRVFMYLTQTRCIAPALVNEFLNSGLLYQDKKGNAVYLHTDNGKPCGAELHGTGSKTYQAGNTPFSQIPDRTVIPTEPYIAELIGRELTESNIKFSCYIYEKNANIVTEGATADLIRGKIDEIKGRSIDTEAVKEDVASKLKGFKGVAAGTSDSFFSYSRGNPQKAYVFESSIDLMSFIALHPDLNDCKFVAMAGLKPFVVEKLLAEGIAVSLCVDNDKAGNEFCKQFTGKCTRGTECIKSGVKDFNDLLKATTLAPFRETVGRINTWAEKSIQQINRQMPRKAEVAR